jgi:hypothetical protein
LANADDLVEMTRIKADPFAGKTSCLYHTPD